VLGVDKVGPHDNFFDLGGHSLRMVEVRARLCEAFGRDIAMVDLFRHPTIAALSRYFDRPSARWPAAQQSTDRAERRRAAVASRVNRKRKRRPT
jgi:aryl carrier-like protein